MTELQVALTELILSKFCWIYYPKSKFVENWIQLTNVVE
jgi:hypothetical protein